MSTAINRKASRNFFCMYVRHTVCPVSTLVVEEALYPFAHKMPLSVYCMKPAVLPFVSDWGITLMLGYVLTSGFHWCLIFSYEDTLSVCSKICNFWYHIHSEFMSSLTADGSGPVQLLPVAVKPVWLTIVVQQMTRVDSNHAFTPPVAQNSTLSPSFHPHMKCRACPRSTVSISLPHPCLLIQLPSLCWAILGAITSHGGKIWLYGGVVCQGGKQLTCFRYRVMFPLLAV
jgi:hypothetical protein